MDLTISCNKCDQGEHKQSVQQQRKIREQDDQIDSETIVQHVDEFDVQAESPQKDDNSSKEPFMEIGGFEPFVLPLFMLENKNKTIFQTFINDQQFCALETSKGRSKQSQKQKNENTTELDEHSIQKSTKNQRIAVKQKKSSNKRSFKVTFMPILLNYQPGEQTKFYLFADRVVDIDYLRRLSKNQEEEINYTKYNKRVSVFKGNKIVKYISHRIDNKCIEIIPEEINKPLENFEQIIQMLLSLGNQNLFEMANNLEHFQNNIQKCKNIIKEQSEDTIFQLHKAEREKATNETLWRITSKLEQDQYIHYIYYKVDYENHRAINYLTGYNPKFYELVAGNAYAFKESLFKDGCYDPIYILNRLNMCLNDYLSQFLQRDPNVKYFQSKFDQSFNLIKTIDGFLIPTILKTKIINLCADYDSENKLNLNVKDFLAINVFQLIEDNEVDNIETQLRDFRMGQKTATNLTSSLMTMIKKILKNSLKLNYFYRNTMLMKSIPQ